MSQPQEPQTHRCVKIEITNDRYLYQSAVCSCDLTLSPRETSVEAVNLYADHKVQAVLSSVLSPEDIQRARKSFFRFVHHYFHTHPEDRPQIRIPRDLTDDDVVVAEFFDSLEAALPHLLAQADRLSEEKVKR